MDYSQIAKEIRRLALKMYFESQTTHIGSGLSIIDILAVLYSKILSLDSKRPGDPKRDRFILSKGHAIAALYATLAQKGFFPKSELENYCKEGGKFFGHSTKDSLPGVEVSTGSLGHGLPMAAGMALAAKGNDKKYRIFVLMSDGECEEGTTWETAMFSAQYGLDNLVAIIDYNKLQALGRTNEITALEPFKEKWAAFGWEVAEIDGHNFSEIEKVFSELPKKMEKPTVVIAHTVKGKGVSFMEDKLEWHYKNLSKEDYQSALNELI